MEAMCSSELVNTAIELRAVAYQALVIIRKFGGITTKQQHSLALVLFQEGKANGPKLLEVYGMLDEVLGLLKAEGRIVQEGERILPIDT